jgi:anhydro-N-acetylmuramic acid kinase
MRAIGLMSGTSMDGIDLALIETDGVADITMGPSLSVDYSPDERALLRRALDEATAIEARTDRPGSLAEVEAMVTAAHGALVARFLAREGFHAADIDVIGFHGQTVLHRPKAGVTVQLGNGAALAKLLGIRVVYDMRAADVAAGGQGAPLVPVYHQALVRAAGLEGPVAVLNLGGIGNVTYLNGKADPIAFDTGPANALIDDEMHIRFGLPFDEGGRMAAGGQVDRAALNQLMGHPYFSAPLPKSLDRLAFSRAPVAHLEAPEAVATLTAFTAESVKAAIEHLPRPPRLWVVCGGGARNPMLLYHIVTRVGVDVTSADDLGWSAHMMEAQAFAFLAVRALKGLPLTFPGTTGVAHPLTGGVIAEP